MKTILSRLTVALIGATSLVSAGTCSDCCWDPCEMDGCWAVGGEALWMKATGAAFDYDNKTTTTTLDETVIQSVVADHDWGFRIFGSYLTCNGCNFITLDWTYLRTSDIDSFVNDSNPSDLANVKARLRFDYDKVNLRFGRNICCGCDSRLYAYVGGRYINIEEKRKQTTVNMAASALTEERTQFEGGGFEVGFGGEHDLLCDFSLVANLGITAAIGDLKAQREFGLDGSTDIRTRIKSRTICVPGAEMRLGLKYLYRCDCWWLAGEFGYQLDYYWRALALLQIDAGGDNTSQALRENVGFAGIYFGLSAGF